MENWWTIWHRSSGKKRLPGIPTYKKLLPLFFTTDLASWTKMARACSQHIPGHLQKIVCDSTDSHIISEPERYLFSLCSRVLTHSSFHRALPTALLLPQQLVLLRRSRSLESGKTNPPACDQQASRITVQECTPQSGVNCLLCAPTSFLLFSIDPQSCCAEANE